MIRRHFSSHPVHASLLSAIAVLLVFVLVGPAMGASPNVARAPPFLNTKQIDWTSTLSLNCAQRFHGANASANLTTGNVSASACARVSPSPGWFGTAAESRAGFWFPVKVGSKVNHHLTANWSVDYRVLTKHSNASGWTWSPACFSIVVVVVDNFNGTSNGNESYFCGSGAGHRLISLSWNGWLWTNQSYRVETYLDAQASAGIYSANKWWSGNATGTGSLSRFSFG